MWSLGKDGVVWFVSVCLSVHWSVWPWALQKRMNRSRCRLGSDFLAPKEPCNRWVCTLAPPGAYDGLICVAAAMRSVATITVRTCHIALHVSLVCDFATIIQSVCLSVSLSVCLCVSHWLYWNSLTYRHSSVFCHRFYHLVVPSFY